MHINDFDMFDVTSGEKQTNTARTKKQELFGLLQTN